MAAQTVIVIAQMQHMAMTILLCVQSITFKDDAGLDLLAKSNEPENVRVVT